MTASGKRFDDAVVGARSGATQARGAAGEALAARFLTQRGLVMIARNIRCRGGELDLIALHGQTLVFIEVRVRSSRAFGGAAASITPTKQRRLLHAAQWWLSGAGRAHAQRPMRFDAVLLESLDPARLEWLTNIISADGW